MVWVANTISWLKFVYYHFWCRNLHKLRNYSIQLTQFRSQTCICSLFIWKREHPLQRNSYICSIHAWGAISIGYLELCYIWKKWQPFYNLLFCGYMDVFFSIFKEKRVERLRQKIFCLLFTYILMLKATWNFYIFVGKQNSGWFYYLI